jgi:hypothetical protein
VNKIVTNLMLGVGKEGSVKQEAGSEKREARSGKQKRTTDNTDYHG